MPELPEVETIRRQLEPELVGRTFVAGDAHWSQKFEPALDAVGATVHALGRRGKYLLFGLDDDTELVAHLGMTGSFSLEPSPDDLPDHAAHSPHTRAIWRLDDGRDLIFRDTRRFGRLHVVHSGDYSDIPTLRDMGPEPLGPDFDGRVLHERMRGSSRAVKTQLLGQRPVAGVGNIYADEALFAAGIDPRSRRVGRERCNRLAETIRDVLAQGVRNGGTTLRDYVDADGRSGKNQYRLAVYGRAGEPCWRCGEILRSFVLDARTTTHCIRCQKY
ncbi:MAG: bifunctional DNA-formamidopyrimidine glycosylase/DNA-(apurinic or apyrimidinic site) lyase [Acidimicrobiales bacterium]